MQILLHLFWSIESRTKTMVLENYNFQARAHILANSVMEKLKEEKEEDYFILTAIFMLMTNEMIRLMNLVNTLKLIKLFLKKFGKMINEMDMIKFGLYKNNNNSKEKSR